MGDSLSTPKRSEDYQAACAIHDRITALYPLVRSADAYRRVKLRADRSVFPLGRPVSVDRDGLVVSLVTKAITTHHAVRTLTDLRLGSDAHVLYRTLLENVVLLEWLLRRSYRLDLYALSDELLVTRIAEATARHYDHRPDFKKQSADRAAQERALVKAVFGDKLRQWAKRLSSDGSTFEKGDVAITDMLDEVSQPDSPDYRPPKQPSFVRAVSYAHASWFAHSMAPSVRDIHRPRYRDTYFRLELHFDSESTLEMALEGANIHGLVAVSLLDQYAGLGLEPMVDSIAQEMFTNLSPDDPRFPLPIPVDAVP